MHRIFYTVILSPQGRMGGGVRRLFLCVFSGLMLAAVPLQALTLDEYLALVLATNPLIRQELIAADIARQNVVRTESARDISLTAQGLSSHAEPAPASPFVPTAIDVVSAEASLAKLFWTTGGRLALGWSSVKTSQNLPTIAIPANGGSFTIPTGAALFYEHSLSLSYSQPLLQNFGGLLNKNAYRAGAAALLSTTARSLENIEAFLVSEGMSFIDWALFNEQLTLARERLSLAREQYENVTRMRRANLVDRTDLIRAQDALQTAEQGALFAASQVKAKQAEMSIALNDESIRNAVPIFDLYAHNGLPAPEEACRRLTGNARLLTALRNQREALRIQAHSARETVRPALNLLLSCGLRGGNEAFDLAPGFDRSEYAAGLNFAYPLGARAAAAGAAAADLSLEQMDLAIEKAMRDLCTAATGLLIRLEDMEKILELNRRQIVLAGDRTTAERALYNQGRGQLTFVIQSMDAELSAKTAYASNAAQYQKMALQYQGLMDQLYQREVQP
jgi:outer membrane protein TolC